MQGPFNIRRGKVLEHEAYKHREPACEVSKIIRRVVACAFLLPDMPGMAASWAGLASVLVHKQQPEAASQLFEEALRGTEAILIIGPPSISRENGSRGQASIH